MVAEKPIHGGGGGGGGGGAEGKERKGMWSPEEDERLYGQITCHGVSTWSSVAQLAGLRRSGKSCRLRWMNYLRPDLKKEPISKREEEIIVALQRSLGNRWSVIAARMPGRTDNEIKNYWNSRVRKRHNGSGARGARQQQQAVPPAPAPAGEEEEVDPVTAAAPTPMFACQLIGGGGGDMASTKTQSTTTTATTREQNAGSESEVSVGNGGDALEQYYYHCAYNGEDMDMAHLLSFIDDLEYPAAGDDLLTADDAPGGGLLVGDDPWESSLINFAS